MYAHTPQTSLNSRVEFEVMVIENNRPRYIKTEGTLQSWSRHPKNSQPVAIVKDPSGKMHMKLPEDLRFL